ncbi:MAG: PHP domain-containing protein [Clostridia bacterium]|nr:PHP domain-containing protein [Clostridia bacterium]
MKKYKTELHCHTSEVSHCAGESAADTVEKYLKYGYSTLVLTNHLARSNFRHMGYGDDTSWEDKAKFYIEGYYKMKEAAAGRMNILFGAEIRFDELENDYLLYGMSPEFMISHPDMYAMTVGEFYEKINHPNLFIIIQAHPMRHKMQHVYPWFVDGWEVYNGHPHNESYNRAAKAYAEYFPNKIFISGSDHHDKDHYPAAGIETDFEIKTMDELMATFRSKDYSLIEEEDIRLGNKRI